MYSANKLEKIRTTLTHTLFVNAEDSQVNNTKVSMSEESVIQNLKGYLLKMYLEGKENHDINVFTRVFEFLLPSVYGASSK